MSGRALLGLNALQIAHPDRSLSEARHEGAMRLRFLSAQTPRQRRRPLAQQPSYILTPKDFLETVS